MLNLKNRLRRTVARVAPPVAGGGVRVLLYHAIDDRDPADVMSLRVPPRQFAEQMTLLRDEGYAVVPLGALCNGPDASARARVAITFDDGYRSQARAAATLRQFGFPATFFVTPRFLDGVREARNYSEAWGHFRWDDVATLIEDGFEVGAHSMTHVDLRRCSAERLDEETAGAKRVLDERLGVEVRSFSYPYGRHDPRVHRAVERAGYALACTSRYGSNRVPAPSYTVRRIEVAGRDSLRDFQWKLEGKYDWVGRWQDFTATR